VIETAALEHRAETTPLGLPVPPLQALAEPALVFAHPDEVLRSPDLTREQKRAMLASWASDAFAVESAPALRLCPGGGRPVRLDDVLAALRALDGAGQDGETLQVRGKSPRFAGVCRPRPRVRWLKGRRAALN